MIYGSVCSGIEAASVAWRPLGWKAAFFSEIEKFPCAVLDHHYPKVPNLGDMTKFKEWPDAIIDVLVGGTPCQSFSIAGLRKGLDDPRGNLMLTFGSIAAKYRSTWLVWENVYGVLSSNRGKDFASFLGLITGQTIPVPRGGWGNSGIIPGYKNAYGVAYRVLDAQHFGIPQRRRRVFVIGHLGDWRRAAAVLFERHSLSGNPAPSREKGKGFAHDIAPCLTSSRAERIGNHRGQDAVVAMHETGQGYWQLGDVAGTLRAEGENRPSRPSNVIATLSASTGDISHCLNAEGMGRQDYETETLITHTLSARYDSSEDGCGRGTPLTVVPTLTRKGDAHSGYRDEHGLVPVAIPINTQVAMRHEAMGERTGLGVGDVNDPAFTLQAGHSHAVAFAQNTRDEVREMAVVGALAAQPGMKQTSYIRRSMQVRRLTPRECERLQGFPDDYTLIDVRGKPAADGPRYKALGNSMAVPVMRWIGERIQMVEEISNE